MAVLNERARRLVLPEGSAVVLAVDAAAAFGFGAAFPFITVYLTFTRGFSMLVAGVVTGVFVLVALAGGPLGGALADRAGPRVSVCLGLGLAAAGFGGLVLAAHPVAAVLAAAVAGFGAAMAAPATDTALATATAPERRATAFSLKYMVHNIAMGAGSVAGAFVIDPDDPASYAGPLVVELGAVALGVVLGLFLPATRTPSASSPAARQAGYGDVARDPLLRRVLGVTLGVFFAGFGASVIAIPAHMAVGLGLDTRLLGIWLAVNTAVVIAVQLVSLRVVRGRRRTSVLAVMAAVWAGSWTLVLLAGVVDPEWAVAVMLTNAAVFGAAETLFAPTLPVLVNAIAPPESVGRYNGAFAFAMTVGNASAMLVTGAALDAGLAVPLFVLFTAVCLVSAATTRRLRLPESVDRIS